MKIRSSCWEVRERSDSNIAVAGCVVVAGIGRRNVEEEDSVIARVAIRRLDRRPERAVVCAVVALGDGTDIMAVARAVDAIGKSTGGRTYREGSRREPPA